MKQVTDSQMVIPEVIQKRDSRTFDDYGAYAVDLSKLTFGSLVLGTVIRGSLDQWLVLGIGSAATALLAIFGMWLKQKSRKE